MESMLAAVPAPKTPREYTVAVYVAPRGESPLENTVAESLRWLGFLLVATVAVFIAIATSAWLMAPVLAVAALAVAAVAVFGVAWRLRWAARP